MTRMTIVVLNIKIIMKVRHCHVDCELLFTPHIFSCLFTVYGVDILVLLNFQ